MRGGSGPNADHVACFVDADIFQADGFEDAFHFAARISSLKGGAGISQTRICSSMKWGSFFDGVERGFDGGILHEGGRILGTEGKDCENAEKG